jgi:hypothetical protein
MELAYLLSGGALVAFGVWLGYRIGYQAKTGLMPSLTEPEYGGEVLDAATYPSLEEEADDSD